MTSGTSDRRALGKFDKKSSKLDARRNDCEPGSHVGDGESNSVNELREDQSGELYSRGRDQFGRTLSENRFSEAENIFGEGDGDDEEEDDEELDVEDEKHQLIGGRYAAKHKYNSSLLIERNHSSNKGEDFAHLSEDYHKDKASLLHLMANYFKFTPNVTTNTKIHSADGSLSRYSRTTDQIASLPINKSAYVKSGQVEVDTMGTAAPNGSGRHSKSLRSLCSRQILLNFLLFLLIISSFLLLIKLITLVQHERMRINSIGDSIQFDYKHLDASQKKQLERDKLSRWLVATPKCYIPVLDPWHESIQEYTKVSAPMNCSQVIVESLAKAKNNDKINYGPDRETKTMTFVRNNKLYFSHEAIMRGALKGGCCFKEMNRTLNTDDSIEPGDTCLILNENGLTINYPLIVLTCTFPFRYTNVHSFIVRNNEEENAIDRVAQSKLDQDHYYNVLMVGVDTMSRLNAQRQLKRTLNVLNRNYKTLDFVGYNKVGENTFPNLIPLLTGLKPEQLVEIECWMVKNYTQENETGDDFLDNCKYLWNFYQQIGYTTYFSEDWPSASTFNYLKPGFKTEPTTYYGRPFTLARKSIVYPQFESMGCASCQLDKPIVQVDLDNLRSFIRYHSGRPYFAFHWINCPQHDDLNGASSVDYILEDFFNQIHDVTRDNRTFVIFFSDHGYRWNEFVTTRIGHYESSLPLLTIAPPKLFIKQHPDLYRRMKRHRNALLTPFDIFKTLIDLKNLSSAKKSKKASGTPIHRATRGLARGPLLAEPLDHVDSRNSKQSGDSTLISPAVNQTEPTSFREMKMTDGTTFKQKFKTLSLFDEHTPADLDRSCIEAGIPDNYCVCHEFQPVQEGRLDVLGAAYYLVYIHLADRLRTHLDICHALDLDKVHKAEVFSLERMQKTADSNLIEIISSRRRRQVLGASSDSFLPLLNQEMISSSSPAVDNITGVSNRTTEESKHLPNREYSIMFSTIPGGGLFQEVVRYYGKDMSKCELEISKARTIVEDAWAEYDDKLATVEVMNSICNFSVHSDSISRFNLYKNQSKCVKSNIELKKICYCNDLI